VGGWAQRYLICHRTVRYQVLYRDRGSALGGRADPEGPCPQAGAATLRSGAAAEEGRAFHRDPSLGPGGTPAHRGLARGGPEEGQGGRGAAAVHAAFRGRKGRPRGLDVDGQGLVGGQGLVV